MSNVRRVWMETRTDPVTLEARKRAACDAALVEFGRLLNTYGDWLGNIAPGFLDRGVDTIPLPLRVTRRGNIYDDNLRETVLHTWGMGTCRERHELAWEVVHHAYDCDYQAQAGSPNG